MPRAKRKTSPREKMRELIGAYWISQPVRVSVQLSVADALVRGPRAPCGRERTREELRDLFARAGLRLARVVPTACPLFVLEAVRA